MLRAATKKATPVKKAVKTKTTKKVTKKAVKKAIKKTVKKIVTPGSKIKRFLPHRNLNREKMLPYTWCW